QSIDYPRLDESDLIILNELTSLPSYLGSMAPTDILILPAEDVEPDAYSTLTGGSLTYRKDTVFSALQMPDLNDPLFQDVFVKKNSTPALPKVKIKFSPPSYDVALLKTDFGTPVLTTRYRRGATIYFLGCPLNENYTQLPTHSLFVPLFYRIAQTSAAINRPLAYRTDQRVLELETTTQPGREQLTITGSNESFIPNVHFSGSRMTLELPPSNLLPGFYSLTSTTDTLQEFALNYAKQESQLDTYSQSELTELAGRHEHVSIVDYANTLQFQDPLYSDLSGESLWKYALILALMFLFAEILLARFL
ncbi:MAG: hypothetical protein OEY56_05145, partial [Cyclobacteriaceae bacterium]|nr:hypothetical protein [Cyclobacteriaceae bacterium]